MKKITFGKIFNTKFIYFRASGYNHEVQLFQSYLYVNICKHDFIPINYTPGFLQFLKNQGIPQGYFSNLPDQSKQYE